MQSKMPFETYPADLNQFKTIVQKFSDIWQKT